MKMLVTGAEGMVGSALCLELRHRGHEVVPTDLRPLTSDMLELDIRDRQAISHMIETVQPAMVMHLAAETDVDRCEQEPSAAYLTNAVGTEYVVGVCRRIGARLLYMSTAGVFDGQQPTPYRETDPPNPVNIYGRTKLAGEVAVQQLGRGYQIVRAGWMVGGFERDKKFVWKILRLLEERREISVVTDKIGSLTFTEDLSRGIATLIDTPHVGIFHMTNHGTCSRYDIACKLVELLGRRDVVIRPITSEGFPLPAPRAPSEAMENFRLRSLGLDAMPTWQEALQTYVRRYLETVKCASSS